MSSSWKSVSKVFLDKIKIKVELIKFITARALQLNSLYNNIFVFCENVKYSTVGQGHPNICTFSTWHKSWIIQKKIF